MIGLTKPTFYNLSCSGSFVSTDIQSRSFSELPYEPLPAIAKFKFNGHK